MTMPSLSLLTEEHRERFAALHRDFMAKVSIELVQFAPVLLQALPGAQQARARALRELSPESDAEEVFRYVSRLREQPTPAAARRVTRPAGIAQKPVRLACARLLELEALAMQLELGAPLLSRIARALKLASNVEELLQVRVRCTACSGNAMLAVRGTMPWMRLRCDDCGHEHDTETGRPSATTTCHCRFCRDLLAALLADLRSLVRDAAPGATARLDVARREFARVGARPTEREMRQDWEVHKNGVGKDLRALITQQPRDAADFHRAIDRHLEVHRGDAGKIVSEAAKCRMIYRTTTTVTPDCSDAADFLGQVCTPIRWARGIMNRPLASLGELPDANGSGPGAANALALIPHWLAGALVPDRACRARLELRVHEYGIEATSDDWVVPLGSPLGLLFGDVNTETSVDIVLNPFFFAQGATESHAPAAAGALRVFRSQTECNAYHRLARANPGCIVVPNYPLKRVVDLSRLRDSFDSEELRYLTWSEVDFTICDERGAVLWVEEIQRGDHHNTTDWIRKDGLKRRALELSGVAFRESF